MIYVAMAVLCGVLYGAAIWAIVRLLQASRSRDTVAIAVIAGLVTLVVNLFGGGIGDQHELWANGSR